MSTFNCETFALSIVFFLYFTFLYSYFSFSDLNFDRLPDYVAKGAKADLGPEYKGALAKEIDRLKSTK